MGGQNHQPTNRIRLIAPSAWLSQCIGDAFSHVLQANSDLERAIIVGMGRLHVEKIAPALDGTAERYLGDAIAHLKASCVLLPEIELAYENLLTAAAMENYTGNPLASRLGDFDLAARFESRLIAPAVNRAAWDELERRIAEDNILATLKWEAAQFEMLRVPTEALIEVLGGCRDVAERDGAREMVKRIECNEMALRQRFAPVFSRWNHLHAMFLYSALIMTELFYMTNDMGTLTSEKPPSLAATA